METGHMVCKSACHTTKLNPGSIFRAIKQQQGMYTSVPLYRYSLEYGFGYNTDR